MRKQLLQKLPVLILAGTLTLAAAAPTSGMFMRAPEAPVDRLIENINAYLDEHPDPPEANEAYFLLARVHYIAFANESPLIRSFTEGDASELPSVTDPRIQWIPEERHTLDEDALALHASGAIENFMRAIELDEENALYRLGLAGILEQAAPFAELIGPLEEFSPAEDEHIEGKADGDKTQDEEDAEEGNEPSLAEVYLARALEENRLAYELGREEALAMNGMMQPFYPAAYEAGKAYLALAEKLEIEVDPELEAQINEDITTIDNMPQAITPIVFRVEGEAPTSVDDLLAPDIEVDFDLDADGTAERRPWVNPDTAILVWDPEHKGEITSGQQLFGNMTFFMLFRDGYQALNTLDNDRDGQLAGEELLGLALWHDRNSNGISEPGEVTPIEKTVVRSIATTQTDREGIHPRNSAGLTLGNGETRPTWDWIAPEIMVDR